MRKDYTHIAVVLDSSGSMGSIFNDTVAGFNHFLKAQKEAEGYATMTLVEFGQQREPIRWNHWNNNAVPNGGNIWGNGYTAAPVNLKFDFCDIQAVPSLNTPQNQYSPQGGTPLLDTMGEVITRTKLAIAALPDALRPAKVLFVIITDGEENASKQYSFSAIQSMIEIQQSLKDWKFIYLGANQDAIANASKMGIGRLHSMSYGLSAQEVGSTYETLASKTASFRCAAAAPTTLDFTDEERAKSQVK